ncbi:HK97 family phage prohead protease [Symbiopectobacterium sp. Eva_TO]
MNTHDIEIRTATLTRKDQALTGYAVKWNSCSHVLFDEFVEQFAPYAFRDHLAAGQDVLALWEHDPKSLLGRTASGTLALHEDETGLHFALNPPDTQLGRDVLTMVERGDITGMSFGFRALKDYWNIARKPHVRTVQRAELKEITITSLPAYPESAVEIARRSLHQSAKNVADNRRRWLQWVAV